MSTLTSKNSRKVVLTFEGTNRKNKDTIHVDSDEKFLLFSHILKGFVSFDEEGLSKNEVSRINELRDTYELKKLISDREWVLSNLEKIPQLLDYQSITNDLKLIDIDKKNIHKTNQENVMINTTEIDKTGNIDIFVGNPTHTSEINLDHLHSNHVEAIFLSELCRQACMATLNSSLGSGSEYFISKEVKKYVSMVIRNKEVIVQTFPVVGTRKKGVGTCFYMLYQEGKICMTGYYLVVYQREVKA